mmetsp:Transcript_7110/g.22488  ORF Transcript_7110/g.22488 Transcript_7110/m.22488 type:complete len:331 (-) Transcript_7110:215-1207(-)|eukprot:CAMPEP_0196771854 /NCGR_PEP_ID=MMETSP1104-20130614/1919_1 /TAXON_ID=33652 /ORGANISM="Cafeteria sp., Strain Caron Lab Isolate" /LENGTH=330 /DNA_ID=CAMNT_0042141983 /DNA_START=3 /DNA_END=995 /DNA_ORIENTATION=+
MVEEPLLVWVCLTCTLTTVALTTHHFIYHYVIYRRGEAQPSLQKLYTRILLVPPIYSVCSWLSLVFTEHSGIFDAARGIYEAYALYCFAALMILYAGGEAKVLDTIVGCKSEREQCYVCPCLPTCCSFRTGRGALTHWKWLLLQFLFVKPIVAVTSAILEHHHLILQADVFLKPLVIVSVTVAMTGLLNIYLSLGDALDGLNAGVKFLVMKASIFFTVWQEVVFHILVGQGLVSPEQDWYCWWNGTDGGCRRDVPQRGIQTVACIVIFEMLAFTLLYTCVFSARDDALARKYKRVADDDAHLMRASQWTGKMLRVWDLFTQGLDDHEWDV